MGKTIKINESQLRTITKNQILEGQRVDALLQKIESFKEDLHRLHNIKDHSKDFFEFLDNIRESGMTNMYQASDLLWSGSDFIERWVYLNAPHLSDDADLEDGEDFEESKVAYQKVLEDADDIRDKVIQTTIGKENVDYDNIDREVKNTSRDILVLWMKHFGTNMGRMKREVDEVARTLSKARKHGSGSKFPKSAIKATPNRFRPEKRVDESFFFGNDKPDISCDNCGHSWEIEKEDSHPELCHMCGYDQKTKEYDVDGIIDFWTNKNT